jgi:hypothetical protein
MEIIPPGPQVSRYDAYDLVERKNLAIFFCRALNLSLLHEILFLSEGELLVGCFNQFLMRN